MNKNILLVMMLALLLVAPIIAAEDFTFKKDTAVDLKVICINSGYCSATSTCNISVFSPTNTAIVTNKLMTRDSSLAFHNYTLTSAQTGNLGQHEASGICIDGSIAKDFAFNFELTSSGSSGVDIIWIILLAIILAFGLIGYGFSRQEHPPITMGGILLLVIALYVWVNGFGILGATELISRFIAASLFVIGSVLSIKSLSELK